MDILGFVLAVESVFKFVLSAIEGIVIVQTIVRMMAENPLLEDHLKFTREVNEERYLIATVKKPTAKTVR